MRQRSITSNLSFIGAANSSSSACQEQPKHAHLLAPSPSSSSTTFLLRVDESAVFETLPFLLAMHPRNDSRTSLSLSLSRTLWHSNYHGRHRAIHCRHISVVETVAASCPGRASASLRQAEYCLCRFGPVFRDCQFPGDISSSWGGNVCHSAKALGEFSRGAELKTTA